ncbi:hypothetical protein N7510_003206 [Penicillium lagena]|uniref:uncharacterized protein n=1 Tax=Penicillium lagena TaxID=94218 RepID=UPI0025406D81|nr:uncharacterized protein N7510_003206 [Penicillium lagena]KAJ5619222.1 hypothetical protein N7510_003206 [Penicillium lagena]
MSHVNHASRSIKASICSFISTKSKLAETTEKGRGCDEILYCTSPRNTAEDHLPSYRDTLDGVWLDSSRGSGRPEHNRHMYTLTSVSHEPPS